MANILILQLLVETIGLAGLEAAGFSATDAASFETFTSYLDTVAQIFTGSSPGHPPG